MLYSCRLTPFFVATFSTLLFCSNLSFAAPNIKLDKELSYPASDWNPKYKKYLTEEAAWLPETWKQTFVISPPPDLKTTAKEIEAMLKLVPLRKAHQNDIDYEIKFEGIYEKFYIALDISPENTPELTRLMNIVFRDATLVVFYYKDHFNRARPYHYYSAINSSIAPPGHPAYPSGHSTQAHTIALALADAFPKQKARLLDVANKIAVNREIAGVHYSSDTAAGFDVAKQIISHMRSHPFYQYTVKSVREEKDSIL